MEDICLKHRIILFNKCIPKYVSGLVLSLHVLSTIIMVVPRSFFKPPDWVPLANSWKEKQVGGDAVLSCKTILRISSIIQKEGWVFRAVSCLTLWLYFHNTVPCKSYLKTCQPADKKNEFKSSVMRSKQKVNLAK